MYIMYVIKIKINKKNITEFMLDIQYPAGGVWGRDISIIWDRLVKAKMVLMYVKWRCTRPRNDPGWPEHGSIPCIGTVQ